MYCKKRKKVISLTKVLEIMFYIWLGSLGAMTITGVILVALKNR